MSKGEKYIQLDEPASNQGVNDFMMLKFLRETISGILVKIQEILQGKR